MIVYFTCEEEISLKRRGKKSENTPSPTALSAGTNKMTDVPCKSSWGGGGVWIEAKGKKQKPGIVLADSSRGSKQQGAWAMGYIIG